MNNFIDLSNKNFLITGSTSGIGMETSIQISKFGGNIIAIGRNNEKLDLLKSQLNPNVKFQKIIYDLENTNNIQSIIEKIEAPLDGIVHSAGVVKVLPLKFWDMEEYTKLRNINQDSILIILSKLVKAKKIAKNASIVLISSIAGSRGMKGNLMYSTTKAALDISAKVIAAELSSQKIRVNTINPGQVETKLTEQVSEHISSEALYLDRSKYPLGYGNISDISNLALFLISDKSIWITGTNITIDGGRSNIIN